MILIIKIRPPIGRATRLNLLAMHPFSEGRLELIRLIHSKYAC